jgi:pimeloyl-ACP methyl ester carboxylesterase
VAKVTAYLATVLLLLPACTQPEGAGFRPTFQQTPCPTEITTVVLTSVSCGFLTVLEDRSDPEGRTIRLLVTRIQPPGGNPSPDPVLTLGIDLGDTPDYAGFAPGAQRYNRELILLDQRGTGHSEPTLGCPEVASIGELLVGKRLSDPAARQDLRSAVESCHARLTSEGVELAAYNLAENAADVEDLRRALEFDLWNIASYGSASRVALEVARRFPGNIRAMWLDTPQFPEVDELTLGIDGTRLALQRLSADCEDDPECGRRFPDLPNALREAVVRLDEDPVSVTVPTSTESGDPIRVVVDAAAFLRALRAMVSDIDQHLASRVPATIYDALDGRLGLVARLLSEEPLCLGYQPICGDNPFFEGAFFSILCHDEVPFVEPSELTAIAGSNTGLLQAYGASPYLDVCEAWDVGEADASAQRAVSSSIPMLIYVGGYDAFGSLPVAERASKTLTASFLIHVPHQGHNVLGSLDCYRDIRNAWIEEPTSPPDIGCIQRTPAPSFDVR